MSRTFPIKVPLKGLFLVQTGRALSHNFTRRIFGPDADTLRVL